VIQEAVNIAFCFSPNGNCY